MREELSRFLVTEKMLNGLSLQQGKVLKNIAFELQSGRVRLSDNNEIAMLPLLDAYQIISIIMDKTGKDFDNIISYEIVEDKHGGPSTKLYKVLGLPALNPLDVLWKYFKYTILSR